MADEKIAKNRKDFPWLLEKIKQPDYADILSQADPNAGSEFYYCHYAGLSKSQRVDVAPNCSMEGDLSKKPVGDHVDAFLEDEAAEQLTEEDKTKEREQKKLNAGVNKIETAFKELGQAY